MKRNRWSSVPVAAAGDSVAVVTVVPVESAIAGKRFTLIEQATGCHESMAPFFLMHRLPSAMCHAMGGVYAVSAATTGGGAGRRGMNDLLQAEK
jgi:hypothetical protein